MLFSPCNIDDTHICKKMFHTCHDQIGFAINLTSTALWRSLSKLTCFMKFYFKTIFPLLQPSNLGLWTNSAHHYHSRLRLNHKCMKWHLLVLKNRTRDFVITTALLITSLGAEISCIYYWGIKCIIYKNYSYSFVRNTVSFFKINFLHCIVYFK